MGHGRAHEIPLSAAELPGARDEDNPLVEAAKLKPKPAFVLAAHIGANRAGGDVTPIPMRERNSKDADVRPGLDEPLPSKSVQIELQSVLQENSFAWSAHVR